MSFDLGVWFESEPVTDQQAAGKYQTLCDLDADNAAPTHPQAAAFYRDLTAIFPDLDATADAEAAERSPWTAGLSTTPTSVVMTIAWSRAPEVAQIVRELADQHGLTCHDPQSGATSHPDFAPTGQRLSLSSCNGSRSINPAPALIEQTLRRLSVDNWFVLMERDDDRWIQVGYGEQAGARPGWYALERREGSAENHYGTTVSDLNEVIKAFQHHAEGDESWTRRFAWNKVQT
jgi:hypothetical protein